MVLSIIVNVAYADKFDSQEEANAFVMQAQNFLICLEMLFSAVAHCFVFTPDEWEDGYREREEERRRRISEPRAFGDSVALGDFINDVKVVMASKKRRKRRKKVGDLSPNNSMEDSSNTTVTSTSDDGDNNYLRSTANEHVQELSMTPPLSVRNQSLNRPRLDTGGSTGSEGDEEVDESLTRIQEFINRSMKKPSSSPKDGNELV